MWVVLFWFSIAVLLGVLLRMELGAIGETVMDAQTYNAVFTQADLNRIALRLNQRPRKTLGFRCPADVFDEIVALTG